MKLNLLGVDLPVSDKVIYATEEASREYINAMKEKPSNRRMYQLGYDEGRKISLDRAWEYVVKASREECGSKEDFIKFVNEYDL